MHRNQGDRRMSFQDRPRVNLPRKRGKAFRASVQRLEARMMLSMFTVSSTLDDGSAGTLRSAIGQVNADASNQVDTIDFNISTGIGPFTISPSSPLPIITHPVLIDGYSQPGASANSLTNADNAALQIVLNGSAVGGDGLAIAASNSTVRGLAIDSFSNGIHLLPGSSQDIVAGNFIGLDASGSSPAGNSQGVLVDGSAANTIGGTTPADRNLVAANGSQNILLTNNASTNLVAGNFVGLTASGTSTLTSPGNGVVMDDAPDNTVGGTALGAGNVIAGQGGDALQIIGPGGNVVQGNLIGTDPTGTIPLRDGTDGLGISNSSNNLIGGTAPVAGNTLAAGRNGIFLDGAADGNVLQGNFIGTNASGATGLGNTNTGIGVFSSSNNLLGGTVAGAGNVIVFNGDRGILFAFSSNGNAVEGNWIGTDPAGAAGMGNASNGVEFIFGPSNNTVGGTAAGAGNVIANNGGAGVALTSGDVEGDAILSNSIYGNAGTGITLAPGANQSQSAPAPEGAVDFGSGFGTAVTGSLSSTPSTTFTLQFFASPTPDPSGHGQGQIFLGSTTATTDAVGNVEFQANLAHVRGSGRHRQRDGHRPERRYLRVFRRHPDRRGYPPAAAVADLYNTDVKTTLNVPAPGILANDISLNGAPFFAVLVTGTSHGKLTLNSTLGRSRINRKPVSLESTPSPTRTRFGTIVSQPGIVTIDVNPTSFVVTNTNDSGLGSLRGAITSANLSNTRSSRPDPLRHRRAWSFHHYTELGAAPAITHATIINDGYSQPALHPTPWPRATTPSSLPASAA